MSGEQPALKGVRDDGRTMLLIEKNLRRREQASVKRSRDRIVKLLGRRGVMVVDGIHNKSLRIIPLYYLCLAVGINQHELGVECLCGVQLMDDWTLTPRAIRRAFQACLVRRFQG